MSTPIGETSPKISSSGFLCFRTYASCCLAYFFLLSVIILFTRRKIRMRTTNITSTFNLATDDSWKSIDRVLDNRLWPIAIDKKCTRCLWRRTDNTWPVVFVLTRSCTHSTTPSSEQNFFLKKSRNFFFAADIRKRFESQGKWIHLLRYVFRNTTNLCFFYFNINHFYRTYCVRRDFF